MDIKDKIIFVADNHGIDEQNWQLVEEIGELLQALNKLNRCSSNIKDCSFDASLNIRYETCRLDLISELADVQIMLWQELYLTLVNKDRFFKEINSKLDREVKRIEGS